MVKRSMAKVLLLADALSGLPKQLLVGVSGGVDSVVLLHTLVALGHKPVVTHFDHCWRVESRADADFVRDLALAAGLKFAGGKAPRSPMRQRETEARAQRYGFFARTAKRLGIPDLVLAHQAEDQVETFLLQLLRGAGAAARGMDPVSHREGLVLRRPWLGVWKSEILAYARHHKLVWREDATNADNRHRRNLLRGRVLPYLRRQISPQVMENLWRAAEIARAESEWLDSLCAEAAGKLELDVGHLKIGQVAQQRRTILRWLQARGVGDISFSDVEAVRGLLDRITPAKVNLSAGKFARRRTGKIFVE